jgi:hypothetical protein
MADVMRSDERRAKSDPRRCVSCMYMYMYIRKQPRAREKFAFLQHDKLHTVYVYTLKVFLSRAQGR